MQESALVIAGQGGNVGGHLAGACNSRTQSGQDHQEHRVDLSHKFSRDSSVRSCISSVTELVLGSDFSRESWWPFRRINRSRPYYYFVRFDARNYSSMARQKKGNISNSQSAAGPASIGKSAAQHTTQPWWLQFAGPAAIMLLVLLAYSNSLKSGFYLDDYAVLTDGYIAGPGSGWKLFRLAQTRPLTYLTFHWNYMASGQNPLSYHWTNIILHAANSILLLAVARKYLSPFVALCVGALFAVHPLQTEAVTYVFARSTLLSTHLALWSLWFYTREKYLGSALMFGASLLAKEETVALPAVFLLLDLFQRRRPKVTFFAALAGFAALAAGRLFYLILASPYAPGVGRVKGLSTGNYLLTEFRVIWVYLRLVVAPLDLNINRDIAPSTSLFSPWTTLPALLALAALLGALLVTLLAGAGKTWRFAALWGLGYFILIAPTSSIVAQADVVFEHRTYLPMVSLLIGIGFLMERIPRKGLAIAFTILVPGMLAGTISRTIDWRDEKTLWTNTARMSPRKARSWLGLGQAFATDDPGKARDYFARGLQLDPDSPELHINYADMLIGAGQPEEALKHFQRAMALTQETADLWSNIGAAYYDLHDAGRCMSSYLKALQIDPCYYNARRNLVLLYASLNEPQTAYQSGEVPSSCHMLSEQAAELEAYRQKVGRR
jgi:protein O-mannosyl-transferase